MFLIDKLKQAKSTQFSFEILPPLKGRNIHDIYKVIDELIEFNPLNINVTYHQQEVVFREYDNNIIEKKTIRKRPGTVAIAAAINYKYKDTIVVPHLICGGFNKNETEDALIDLSFLSINNLLVLRGDPPTSQKKFIPEKDGHANANELVTQIMQLNQGLYCDNELKNTKKTRFSVGVAGYPEKHNEAPNIEQDIYYLKKKIDAGADYIVTQMFFDNQKYFNFVKICRNAGINVPIIPGIKPIINNTEVNLIPKTFNVDIPIELTKELSKATTNEAFFKIGQEWTVAQSKELIKFGVPEIHYFTLSKAENVKEIIAKVF
ncbi:MAG: methylenetetrahydrofolate reductase [Bacteroidales bacterium]|nr:methylenetetrahydrofolate reductase [Bacteroidales bacterium]